MFQTIVALYLLTIRGKWASPMDFSLLLPVRQISFYNTVRVDKISVSIDKSILDTNINDTLSKLLSAKFNLQQSDLNDYETVLLARAEDKMVRTSQNIRNNLNLIKSFTGRQTSLDLSRCNLELTTTDQSVFSLLDVSGDLFVKETATIPTTDKFRPIFLLLNNIQQQLETIHKNTTDFYQLALDLEGNDVRTRIKYLLKSSRCIDKSTPLYIKNSFCSTLTETRCYVDINYLEVDKETAKYTTIPYANKSLCYPSLYYSQDSFFTSECHPDCQLIPLPERENACLTGILEDPTGSLHNCKVCDNVIQWTTSTLGTICHSKAIFQPILNAANNIAAQQITYTYIGSNGTTLHFSAKTKVDIERPTLIQSAHPFLLTIRDKKYIFKPNSDNNILKESVITNSQLSQLNSPTSDFFNEGELTDLLIPSSISTVAIVLFLLTRFLCFRINKIIRKKSLEKKLLYIQKGERENKPSRQLTSFLSSNH